MNILLLQKPKTALFHFLFWVGVWAFFIYFFSYNSEDQNYVVWFSSFLLPVTMLTTYFVNYFLIPKYLLKKKYKLFALYGIYTLVFSTYFIMITMIGCFIVLSKMNIAKMPPMSRNYIFILILVYLVVALVSFVKLLNHNMNTISANKELQNKILETQLQIKNQELQYLKKQIHPHFLFNSLNTIYGLSLNQSSDTPKVILKLSNLLDYILYQVNKPFVPLKNEILHIKEYIDLEKVRFQDTLKVNFESNEIPENIQIEPMLLTPFIENAFKHGDLVDGILTVHINIQLIDNKLNFSIKNTFLPKHNNTIQGGIGLENIKKRLNLLYKDNHSLTFNNTDDWYHVKLIINNLNEI